jgi:hypothetical protein
MSIKRRRSAASVPVLRLGPLMPASETTMSSPPNLFTVAATRERVLIFFNGWRRTPNAVGTRISATIAETRPLMIRTMNVATMAKAIAARNCSVWLTV